MKRAIIRINEKLCNGCGKCVDACAEGAIKLVNGKAKLVKEQYCDGFGDCLGECPTGALTIEKREAPGFDREAVLKHVRAEGGEAAVTRMRQAEERHQPAHAGRAPDHGRHSHGPGSGCPGLRQRMAEGLATGPAFATADGAGLPSQAIPSELHQWPVQIHLVSPDAPYFRNRELVVLSTCAPVASADVHWRFLRGRAVVVGCPKLDRTEGYAEKLASILQDGTIPAVVVVRMEVPCCGGLTALVREAAGRTGRSDLTVREVVVGLNGDVRPATEVGPG
jgi:ferredoxin